MKANNEHGLRIGEQPYLEEAAGQEIENVLKSSGSWQGTLLALGSSLL